MTYQELYTKLEDDSSNAFLGSAIALSSYSLFTVFDEERAEDFLSLSSADALLYMEQVNEESIYSKEEIVEALDCYDTCLSDFVFASRLHSDDVFKNMISLNSHMFEELFEMSYSAVNQKRGIEYKRKEEDPIQDKRRYLINLNKENMMDVILPLLVVLRKLLKRRQNRKKPYTFKEETDCILTLLDDRIKARNITSDDLAKLSSFSLKCTTEIKMVSLKNDYIYLSQFYKTVLTYFE